MRRRPSSITVAAVAAAALLPAPAAAGATAPLRIPLPAFDGSLTPYTFETAYPLVTLIYDTLTWRDPQGAARPWLARSLVTSEDGRTVTVRLHPGVRWHDGRALTARDVAFTFDHLAKRPHPRFTPQTAAIRSVRALDAGTVRFRLRTRSLGFTSQPLADVPILPRHLWADVPAHRLAPPGLPVGSGPYRLTRASRRTGYRFEANPSYFRGAPRPGELAVGFLRTAEATSAALRRRQVDMLPVSLPPGVRAEVEGLGIRVREGSVYAGTALVLNTRRAPFDDPRVRRALSAAIDPRRIARASGGALPATAGHVHPASRWAPPALKKRSTRPRLNGVGGFTILAPDNDPVRLEAARQVALAVRRVGGVARVRTRLGARIDRALRGSFDAAVVAVPALASIDPDFLRAQFGSRAPLNVSGYASATFDRLAARVASAPDPVARERAVLAELEHLARDVPSVPLFFPRGAFAYRPQRHDGWVYVAGTGILDKQSFLTRVEPEQEKSPAPLATRETGREGRGPLTYVAIALLAAALGLAALAFAARFHNP